MNEPCLITKEGATFPLQNGSADQSRKWVRWPTKDGLKRCGRIIRPSERRRPPESQGVLEGESTQAADP
jgi:hypothetical protein